MLSRSKVWENEQELRETSKIWKQMQLRKDIKELQRRTYCQPGARCKRVHMEYAALENFHRPGDAGAS